MNSNGNSKGCASKMKNSADCTTPQRTEHLSAPCHALSMRLSARGRLALLLAPLLPPLPCLAGSARTLTFPLPSDGDRGRYSFEFELLQAALSASQPKETEPDQLVWSELPMNLSRARLEVAAGKLSVMYGYSSPETNQTLTQVPFAIDKALSSYRVLLTRRSLLPKLASIRNGEDLRAFRFGVLASWNDRRTLHSLGYKVESTESFSGLFKMLAAGRSDLIMSGLLHVRQVTSFLAEQGIDLEWEPLLLIVAPSRQHFYTARTSAGEALAKRLQQGLQRLQANGDFDRLHAHHFGEQMAFTHGRRVVHLAAKP